MKMMIGVMGAILAGGIADGQGTERASLGAGGVEGNGASVYPAVSADGHFVAFESDATNLVPGGTNGAHHVFVRDRFAGTTELVSVATGGAQGNTTSTYAAISADGRYVAFESYATNLVLGDSNGFPDIFVRDRQAGTTERVSVTSTGIQATRDSHGPSISADGRYVAFMSMAWNLSPGDPHDTFDVFVHDRVSGATDLVSRGLGGGPANHHSYYPSISADGRFIAFHSAAWNLVAGDTNGTIDVFVDDRTTLTLERVSVGPGGSQGNFASLYPSISGDGSIVAFHSLATNLVAGDLNGWTDVFVRDRTRGMTQLVSLDSGGAQGNGDSSFCCISRDGRKVAFETLATNLVPGDSNGKIDMILRDRSNGTTARLSVDSNGVEGNGDSQGPPSMSADARFVAFHSTADNLVAADLNLALDVFVRDRDVSGFTSLCDAGLAGVLACPCGNPPAGPGRGCNNSSGTGGAVLTAAGAAYLAADALVFTTSGQRPTALSIVLEGDAVLSSGAVYGQGIRCVGGSLKRLYTKSATAGGIVAPDFGLGEPTVSARSAATGSPIAPGENRWYLVYYRDPNVLGGCAASQTFNSTQTGSVAWMP